MPTPKEGPLTVDPVTEAFRKMQKGKPSRPGAGTINRRVVAPFTEDGSEPAPPSTNRRGTSTEQRGGSGEATRRKISEFYEEGLAESERLQKRRRRTS